jgi:hypothetical protein
LFERFELSFRARLLRAGLLDQRSSRLELLLGFRKPALGFARATGDDGQLAAIPGRLRPLERELLELGTVAVVARKPRSVRADQGAPSFRNGLANPAGLRSLGSLGDERLRHLSGLGCRDAATGREQQRDDA